jgi:hypothetical protein
MGTIAGTAAGTYCLGRPRGDVPLPTVEKISRRVSRCSAHEGGAGMRTRVSRGKTDLGCAVVQTQQEHEHLSSHKHTQEMQT